MSKKSLAQQCAGCRSGEYANYPLIKIPVSGEIDTSRYPAIAVNYYLYCFKCVQAMVLQPKPPSKWWQFWRWFEKPDPIDEWREERGLICFTEKDLEKIYA